MKRVNLAASLLAGTLLFQGLPAKAADQTVKLGVLTDMSGVFSDANGKGSVIAAEMAKADVGPIEGFKVEVVGADHQNKPDIGSSIARKWFDTEGVDVVLDIPVSSIALAVQRIAQEKDKIVLLSSSGASEITGKFCSENTIQWTYNTSALSNVAGRATVKRGDDSWFFITTDYAFGHALERDATEAVTASGGKVVGRALNPIGSPDFSSYLLTAQGSGAKVVALASSGGDMQTAVKQAAEFGLQASGQKLLGLLFDVTDIKGLGLEVTQGMYLSTPFYWDRNAESRAFSERFKKLHGKVPTMHQAGVYSATRHYLNAIKAAATKDTKAVLAKMRETPVNDVFAQNGRIRRDGQMIHDFFLVEVKKPSESKGEWDYYNVISTVPGDQAFQPETNCPRLAGQ
ncbi:ABC transporter substrate-binding protein [Enterovirga rhinocerotis]|uniref:Branched-chain amino acid transport system substrate-binding protein n=1 Tax=Enterovirga rhinocerotis TaxID=1339210 RepID=A0A4R7BWV2_9HYPH|nr:ABC transporter substrate-binding protein [Enterovirga rhinocerotis]TDR89983.1 branched-chain amino acid transport system substrate-binding protein [Enterovirga rhinocerotis]